MKEHPIIFSAPMVRAILAGRKTQTRRLVKPGAVDDWNSCPYGGINNLLWVRETWGWFGCERDPAEVIYRADGHTKLYDGYGGWRSPIHMPRWASRITLEIDDVRVQRLQDISEEDAKAEGVGAGEATDLGESHVLGFLDLWESIYGPGAWDKNPLVWALTFRDVSAALKVAA